MILNLSESLLTKMANYARKWSPKVDRLPPTGTRCAPFQFFPKIFGLWAKNGLNMAIFWSFWPIFDKNWDSWDTNIHDPTLRVFQWRPKRPLDDHICAKCEAQRLFCLFYTSQALIGDFSSHYYAHLVPQGVLRRFEIAQITVRLRRACVGPLLKRFFWGRGRNRVVHISPYRVANFFVGVLYGK